MNYFDYLVIAILAIGFILGFKDGIVRKIIGLAGLIIGVILAIEYSGFLGAMIAPLFDNEIYFAKISAGIFIFLVVFLIAIILKRVIHPHDKVNKLINQTLGGFAGVIQIIIFLSGFLFLLNLFDIPDSEVKDKSIMYSSVYSILPKSIDMLIGGRDILTSYIDKYNKTEFFQDSNKTSDDSLKVLSKDSLSNINVKKVRYSK